MTSPRFPPDTHVDAANSGPGPNRGSSPRRVQGKFGYRKRAIGGGDREADAGGGAFAQDVSAKTEKFRGAAAGLLVELAVPLNQSSLFHKAA